MELIAYRLCRQLKHYAAWKLDPNSTYNATNLEFRSWLFFPSIQHGNLSSIKSNKRKSGSSDSSNSSVAFPSLVCWTALQVNTKGTLATTEGNLLVNLLSKIRHLIIKDTFRLAKWKVYSRALDCKKGQERKFQTYVKIYNTRDNFKLKIGLEKVCSLVWTKTNWSIFLLHREYS